MIFKIEYYHSSAVVGNIPANTHFWMYLDGSIGEPVESVVDEGTEDGYKNFTPTFQKSTKTYTLETVLIPEYLVDAIHRMKYFNTKEITMINGDIEPMKNVKTSVSYPFDNKSLAIAKIEFDIDEMIVVVDC
jgi:hypothetical protein